MAIVAPSVNTSWTIGTAGTVCVLFLAWIIQLVALSYAQARADTTREFPGPFLEDRDANSVYAWDWWLFALFTLVNLGLLYALVMDRREGSVVKYRIVAASYASICAVFAALRCNSLVFLRDPATDWARVLLAAYVLYAVGFFLVPLWFGTGFLNTVAQGGSPRESTSGMMGREMGGREMEQGAGGYTQPGTVASGAAVDVPLHA